MIDTKPVKTVNMYEKTPNDPCRRTKWRCGRAVRPLPGAVEMAVVPVSIDRWKFSIEPCSWNGNNALDFFSVSA